MQLTKNQVKKIFKRKDLDTEFIEELIIAIGDEGKVYKIDTPIRVVRFLAQAVSETLISRNGKVRTRENLNYKPTALKKLSKYFRNNPHLADKYGRTSSHKADQMAIANLWYADKNRSKWLRLGNTEKGDGWRYRGSGLLQDTGRYNTERDIKTVEKLSQMILHDHNGVLFDDVLDSYAIYIRLGMAYWFNNGCYNCNSTLCVTNLVNRGLPIKHKKQRTKEAVRIKGILDVG
jgi:putative chitinase